MRLVFITIGRFFRAKDGEYYGMHGGYPISLWTRYLAHFDEVVIAARACDDFSREQVSDLRIPREKGVHMFPLAYWNGPRQFLTAFPRFFRDVRRCIEQFQGPDTIFLCRVPSENGAYASSLLRRKGIPYGVEVVGDPWDVFASGSIKHWARPLFRILGYLKLRKSVRNASAAIYVTRRSLQRRYPPRTGALSAGVSDVQLSSGFRAVAAARRPFSGERTLRLVCVGTLETYYKAPDVVLRALAELKKRGEIRFELHWCGAGNLIGECRQLAVQLGLGEDVVFLGALPRELVLKELAAADLFVMVSRQEGLPRAMVEAMATGLPCIGSTAGGIPELLDTSAVVPVNDHMALANKVAEFAKNPNEMARQSKINLQTAEDFYPKKLEAERKRFFDALKDAAKKGSR